MPDGDVRLRVPTTARIGDVRQGKLYRMTIIQYLVADFVAGGIPGNIGIAFRQVTMSYITSPYPSERAVPSFIGLLKYR